MKSEHRKSDWRKRKVWLRLSSCQFSPLSKVLSRIHPNIHPNIHPFVIMLAPSCFPNRIDLNIHLFGSYLFSFLLSSFFSSLALHDSTLSLQILSSTLPFLPFNFVIYQVFRATCHMYQTQQLALSPVRPCLRAKLHDWSRVQRSTIEWPTLVN